MGEGFSQPISKMPIKSSPRNQRIKAVNSLILQISILLRSLDIISQIRGKLYEETGHGCNRED